jgi:hypothetical protein
MKKDFKLRLKEAEKRLELLRGAEYLYDYFYPVRKARTSYIVEMRKVVSLRLLDQGLLKIDLATIFGKDHASVLHNLITDGMPNVIDVVSVNYEQWIADGVYPDTVYVTEHSNLHANGVATIINYELVDVLDVNREPSSRFISKKKKL